jgi:hypothetical protein
MTVLYGANQLPRKLLGREAQHLLCWIMLLHAVANGME